MQQWIGAINKAAARYSSPPLAAPISSSLAFQRPTFPLAPTKNTLEQQIEHHEAKVCVYCICGREIIFAQTLTHTCTCIKLVVASLIS